MNNIPITTRLRYVSAKGPKQIVEFFNRLGLRVQIYGNPVWDGKRWVCWFVPPDRNDIDVKSMEL
jgi:hypothetical protein